IDEQVKILEAEINKKEKDIDWKKHDEAQRRIEAEQLKIDAESAKIDAEARKIDEQARKIDAQSRRIEAKMRLQEKEFQRQESLQKDLAQKIMNNIRKAGYDGKIHSFELNDNALIINGKTQSESLFKEVKKHLQPGMRITYQTDTH
ncbi:hypothetical protein, partial [uncultured Fluviicola sp.]|uniref:hypothetical protein n=1 Tax=uncultured Fluviicola sp. TaxID=463303 RepID=UPI0025F7C194